MFVFVYAVNCGINVNVFIVKRAFAFNSNFVLRFAILLSSIIR